MLTDETVKALNIAIPALIQQAQAMAAKTKIKSHAERLAQTIRQFQSLQASLQHQYVWKSDDYRTAYTVLTLACEFVPCEGVNFDAAWDEIEAVMKQLNLKPEV